MGNIFSDEITVSYVISVAGNFCGELNLAICERLEITNLNSQNVVTYVAINESDGLCNSKINICKIKKIAQFWFINILRYYRYGRISFANFCISRYNW